MKIVLLSRDLMLTSRIDGVASQKGYAVSHAADQASAVAAVADEECQLLFVDLQLPGLDIVALVSQVRETRGSRVQIIACGPHVHEQRLAAARQAGCDHVVTRGQLDREADTILMTNAC